LSGIVQAFAIHSPRRTGAERPNPLARLDLWELSCPIKFVHPVLLALKVAGPTRPNLAALGEPVTLAQALGGVTILAGIFVARPRPSQPGGGPLRGLVLAPS
jgi:hypothetical protein